MSLGVMVVTGPLDYEVEMGRRVRDQVVKALSESFGDVEASPQSIVIGPPRRRPRGSPPGWAPFWWWLLVAVPTV